MPPALPGEGAFAASGTCIAVEGKSQVWFGTGGPEGARVFRSTDGGRTWEVSSTPLMKGKTAGVFSVTFWNASHGIVVGGDYTKEQEAADNVALTRDGGRTWEPIGASRPGGYRSCAAFVQGTRGPSLVAVGPSGSDFSDDGGRSWARIVGDGFHSLSFAGRTGAGWAVGEGGRVARYGAESVRAK
jgi:photosystem II stability/assembly factor-like uncharacterized protein